MKLVTLLVMLLLTTSTQAGVFKCKTPNGFAYSEKPCPDGASAGPVKVIPASGDPISKVPSNVTPPETSGGAGKAYPPITEKQRQGYERHLSRANPKAFIICADKRAMSFYGQASYVQKQLASLPAGCSPYSIDDAVVWAK
ncbi:MAG: hypothetical protein Q7U91_05180 [Sideroxyarcus sp.]|nr:hypothetical protein [Sideroxyarcus sp.]